MARDSHEMAAATLSQNVEHNHIRRSTLFDRFLNKYVEAVVPTVKRDRRLNYQNTETLISYDSFLPHDGIELNTHEREYSCSPIKLAIISISMITLIIFIIDNILDQSVSEYLAFEPGKRIQFWRFMTYMLVHANWMHLSVNLTVLLIMGIPLEMVHGWFRVTWLYLLGGISGSLAISVLQPDASMVGASGGVYTLMTAFLASMIINWNDVTYPYIQLMLISLVIVLDFLFSIYHQFWLDVVLIAYISHYAGEVTGIMVGIYALKCLTTTGYKQLLRGVSISVYICIIAVFIVLNIFNIVIKVE